jgi:O-antigen/teichoic acid export membrane protein
VYGDGPLRKLRSLVGRARASSFARGAAWVVAGNGAGHLMLLAASPVLTRLYAPDEFGAFGAFMAVMTILVAVAALRYDVAIPVAPTEAGAVRLAVLALTLVATTAVAAAVGAVVLGWAPAGGSGPPGGYGLWLGLGVAGVGGYGVLASWSARGKQYRVLSLSRITRSFGQVAVQLGLGAVGFGGAGLLVGHVVGGFAGMARMVRTLLAGIAAARIAPSELRATARTYRRYPFFSTPSAFLAAVGNQAPLLVMLAAFGPEVGGLFAFAQRIVAAPVTVIGVAVGQVFVGEFGALVRRRSPAASGLYLKTIVRLFSLGVVPGVLLAIVAPGLFGVVFGAAWTDAGVFVRWLAAMLVAQFAVGPVSSVLNLLERTRTQLLFDVVRLLLGLGTLGGLVLLGQPAATAVAGYAGGMFVAYVLNGVLGYVTLRRELNHGPARTP